MSRFSLFLNKGQTPAPLKSGKMLQKLEPDSIFPRHGSDLKKRQKVPKTCSKFAVSFGGTKSDVR